MLFSHWVKPFGYLTFYVGSIISLFRGIVLFEESWPEERTPVWRLLKTGPSTGNFFPCSGDASYPTSIAVCGSALYTHRSHNRSFQSSYFFSTTVLRKQTVYFFQRSDVLCPVPILRSILSSFPAHLQMAAKHSAAIFVETSNERFRKNRKE